MMKEEKNKEWSNILGKFGIEWESKDLNRLEKVKMCEFPVGNGVHREFYGEYKMEP